MFKYNLYAKSIVSDSDKSVYESIVSNNDKFMYIFLKDTNNFKHVSSFFSKEDRAVIKEKKKHLRNNFLFNDVHFGRFPILYDVFSNDKYMLFIGYYPVGQITKEINSFLKGTRAKILKIRKDYTSLNIKKDLKYKRLKLYTYSTEEKRHITLLTLSLDTSEELLTLLAILKDVYNKYTGYKKG